MTDDLERRLREAFEAKATSVTPSMVDMDREREFADELDDDRGPRRWMVGGLSAAAAVAAAIGIGVVVSNQHPPAHEPVVAASSHHTETSSATQPPSPSSTPLRHPKLQSVAPPQTTQVPPPTTRVETPPPPVSTTTTTTTTAPSMSQDSSSAPSHSTSAPASPTTSADGNYYLHGDLRRAAGVDFLPLPASPPTTVVDQTGRTTRLSTSDCAAVLSYWNTAMPANGWKQAPRAGKEMWFAPTGNAWAFTDKTSGACTIQISASP